MKWPKPSWDNIYFESHKKELANEVEEYEIVTEVGGKRKENTFGKIMKFISMGSRHSVSD